MNCKDLFAKIDELNGEYLDMLETVCGMESPTADKERVDALGRYFADYGRARGWDVDVFPVEVSGDVVTLTSSAFTPNLPKSADGIYTATTQTDGYAYFYGTMAEQSENFKLKLTAIGSKALDTPVTLLEASALVPVELEAGKAYWLDASAKRNDVSQ